VRCRTTTGAWQENTTDTTPFPHGVRGIHTVPVHVGAGPAGPAIRRLAGAATTRLSWAARSVASWRHPDDAGPSKPEIDAVGADRRELDAKALVERFQRLPAADPERLRDDIDAVIDQRLDGPTWHSH
jgi:hypothetical protein